MSGTSVAQAHAPAASGPREHAVAARAASPADDIPPDFCRGRADGNYPYPGDDTKMISCVAQQYIYVRHCFEGLHFDPEYSECD
ncbi:carbohydrate-binding module family 14 protein [Streptomyces sp. NPDC007896]|uniref:carbohydrate-binding module family 14 protein n=1 Tax=unclassified Streptomyces TaxID=2593676 RepID=UPI0036ED23BC